MDTTYDSVNEGSDTRLKTRSAFCTREATDKYHCTCARLRNVILDLLMILSAYELYTATTSSTTTRGSPTGGGENIPRTQIQGTTPKGSKQEADLAEAELLCKQFKSTLSQPNVGVHFVGAW
jgi:hypothetical protein